MSRHAALHKTPAGLRLAVALVAVVALIVGIVLAVESSDALPSASPAAVPLAGPAPLKAEGGRPGDPAPGGDPALRTLVLYTSTGASSELTHQDAIQAANLASHRAAWQMRPVEQYRAGDIRGFSALVYVGRYSDVPLPRAFLTDLATTRVPTLWLGGNIDQLFQQNTGLKVRFGWSSSGDDPDNATVVEYGGADLQRRTGPSEALKLIQIQDPTRATVLGWARHASGSRVPWAVQSGTFRYISEIPFSYVDTQDRYLAAADIVDRMLVPQAPERHRALIRIEDVGPNTDPNQVKAIADLLSSKGIPFSIATYPFYRDPLGANNNGTPAEFRLVDSPRLVEALKYARDHGATLILHGYTHQYSDVPNPYNGVSAADFEFYRAHVDGQNKVQMDGPVEGDSRAWATGVFDQARAEFVRVGLPDPGVFEFPHYAGSAADYAAVDDVFGARYDQGTYFDGLCPFGDCSRSDVDNHNGLFQQYFPYSVRDVYGSAVVPENLGNVSEAYNDNEARTPDTLIASAAAMKVVRDGVASAFFHPFLPLDQLDKLVTGIQNQGFTFVAPGDVIGHGTT